jgi:hypothetical protein
VASAFSRKDSVGYVFRLKPEATPTEERLYAARNRRTNGVNRSTLLRSKSRRIALLGGHTACLPCGRCVVVRVSDAREYAAQRQKERRKMKRIAMLAGAVFVTIAGTTAAMNDNDFRRSFKAFLTGHEEVPIVLTTGRGTLTATINREGTQIAYKLKYSDLETDATQAHIHVGQTKVNGGISVWLCSNLPTPPTPPSGAPACPLREGEVEGVLTAEDVVGPASQGIVAGDLRRLLFAIRSGNTYANVHTMRSPGGEIRSQIKHDHH